VTLDDVPESPSDFTAYSRTRLPVLRELAYALTGDPQRAAELARAALVYTGRRWSRLRRDHDRDLAVTTALVRQYLAGYRGPVVLDQRPSETEAVADRAKPPPAIAQLPELMRTVLALRYVSGWSDAEIAPAVRAARGTVRSRTVRGLAQLTRAGLLPPGPAPDRELVHRLLVPPGSLPPADPAEAPAITAEVRWGRRRHMLTAVGLGTVVAGAIATAILVGPGLSPLDRGADPAPAILTRPQTTGSIPEPVVKQVPDLDGLAGVLPGMSLTGLDLGRFEIRGTTTLGTLVGSTGTGRDTQVAEFDLTSGTETVLAGAGLPFVDAAAGDDSTVVWIEAEHERVEGGYRQRNLTLRCLDRTPDAVESLELPTSSPRGVPYPDTGSALLSLAVGSSGRIVLAIGGFGDGRALSQSSDLYVARRCGEPFVLLSEMSRSPRFAGDELYYLRFDGVREGLWRRRIAQPGPAGAPRDVAAPASRYQLTADAVLWDAREQTGFGGGTPDLHVARLDGSEARPVPSVEDLDIASAARTGLAGQILDPSSSTFHSEGLWLYLPSWGAILTVNTPDDGTGRELTVHDGGANSFLVTESAAGGTTGRDWLLQLP